MGKIKIDEIAKAREAVAEEIGVMRKVEGSICELVAIRGELFKDAIKSDESGTWIPFNEGKLPANIEKIVEQIEIQEAEEQGYILRVYVGYSEFVDWRVEVWKLIPQEKIAKAARKNLIERERSIATGIGIFAAVYTEDGKILLRVRTEKGSLYGKDLSGKPELPGGGTDMRDFEQILSPETKYTSVVLNTLGRELEEETGLLLQQLPGLKMYPAWLLKEPLIDLAFVVPVKVDYVTETDEYKELKEKNQVRFFSSEEVADANITSPRMRFLIESVFSAIQNKETK